MSHEAKRRKAFQDYYEDKLDELGLAQILGFPTETEPEQAESIQKIRDMITPQNTPRPFTGGVGIFIGSTKVTSGGKTQIPAAIRKLWGLKDGHLLRWFDKNGDIIIVPSTPWRKGRLR